MASPSTPQAGSSKAANAPFRVHQNYLKKQEAAKAKGGDVVVPPASLGGAALGALKWVIIALVTSLFLSRMVTESWNWGYTGKYADPVSIMNKFFPPKQRLFTEAQLAMHDGSRAGYPVFIAIDGDVYDVSTSAATYGPGGGYAFFAGVDAARSYVTGCFKTHLTHDIRGFTENDMKGLDHWKKFFAGHEKYTKVGTVQHAPIDPLSPLPPPCQ